MFLVLLQIAGFIVHGVLEGEHELAAVQLLLRYLPGEAAGLRLAGLEHGLAEILDLLAVGIIRRHSAGHIGIAGVGHLNRHGDLFGRRKVGLAQLNGELEGIRIGQGMRAQAYERQHEDDSRNQPFLHNSYPDSREAVQPPSVPAQEAAEMVYSSARAEKRIQWYFSIVPVHPPICQAMRVKSGCETNIFPPYKAVSEPFTPSVPDTPPARRGS